MHPGFLCPQGEAAVVKNAVPCLGQLLAAHNPADWPSAIRPFNLLLRWVYSCQMSTDVSRSCACLNVWLLWLFL